MTTRFAILRHRAKWDPDWPLLKSYPETFPMQDLPRSNGKGAPIPILPAMWRYIEAINDELGYRYARSIGMMWINTKYDQSDPNAIPKAESIENSHNFVSYDDETSSHLHLRAFPYTEDLFVNFNPALHNWYTMPHLFFKAIAANLFTHSNPTKGIDVFLPLLKRTEVYVPINQVERFPELPFAGIVTAGPLRIRDTYDLSGAILGYYYVGDPVVIQSYRLRGASVWGKTDKGWICLMARMYTSQNQFFTTWKLNTMGVIPPAL